MRTLKLFIAILISGLIISCSKTNSTVKPVQPATSGSGVVKGSFTGGAGVYIAGFETLYKVGADSLAVSIGIPRIAKIWKNGVAANLTDGSYDAVANAVYANGTDVYAAGFERNADSIQVATVWKNGVATRLGDGKNNSEATGVFISGNDVYVAGNVITSGNSIGYLWKNGTQSAIKSCLEANSLFADNGSVYVAGQDAALLPAVWKDGTLSELPNSANQDYPANVVYVDATNVYVGGQGLSLATNETDWFEKLDTLKIGLGEYSSWVSELSTRVAMAWLNGVASNPTGGDEISAIYAHSGLVILGGEQYLGGPLPTVWKNGLPTVLNIGIPYTSNNSYAAYAAAYITSLTMDSRSNLYVAGYRSTFANNDQLKAHTVSVPLLWQNGVPAVLNNGDSDATLKVYKKTGGRAQAIFIVN